MISILAALVSNLNLELSASVCLMGLILLRFTEDSQKNKTFECCGVQGGRQIAVDKRESWDHAGCSY